MSVANNLAQDIIQMQDKAEEIAITKLRAVNCDNTESAHEEADLIMLAFTENAGFEDVKAAYDSVIVHVLQFHNIFL